MSSWLRLIAETDDDGALFDSLRDAYEADGYEPEFDIELPLESGSNRVRVVVPLHTFTDPELDEASEEPGSGMGSKEFLELQLEAGAIGPVTWAVILTGNDTSDAGSVTVFDGETVIDEFDGAMRRHGYDAAAYLERYHGVAVDPMPSRRYWLAEDRYDPDPDVRGHDPEQTLSVGDDANHDVRPAYEWLSVHVGTDDYEAADGAFHPFLTDRDIEHRRSFTENQRIVLDTTERDSLVDALLGAVEDGRLDAWWTVVFEGDGPTASVDAVVFCGDERIDAVEGESGAYGADVAAYLRRHHGLDLDPLPDATTLPTLADPAETVDALSAPDDRLMPSFERLHALCGAIDAECDYRPWDTLRAAATDGEFGEETVLDTRLGALADADPVAYVHPSDRTDAGRLAAASDLLDDTYTYEPRALTEVLVYAPAESSGAAVAVRGSGAIIATAAETAEARALCAEILAASRQQSVDETDLPSIRETTVGELLERAAN